MQQGIILTVSSSFQHHPCCQRTSARTDKLSNNQKINTCHHKLNAWASKTSPPRRSAHRTSLRAHRWSDSLRCRSWSREDQALAWCPSSSYWTPSLSQHLDLISKPAKKVFCQCRNSLTDFWGLLNPHVRHCLFFRCHHTEGWEVTGHHPVFSAGSCMMCANQASKFV